MKIQDPLNLKYLWSLPSYLAAHAVTEADREPYCAPPGLYNKGRPGRPGLHSLLHFIIQKVLQVLPCPIYHNVLHTAQYLFR